MTNNVRFAFLCTLAWTMLSGCPGGVSKTAPDKEDEATGIIVESDAFRIEKDEDGYVNYFAGEVVVEGDSTEDRAKAFVEANEAMLGVEADELVAVDVTVLPDGERLTVLRQTIDGLEVIGADITITEESMVVASESGFSLDSVIEAGKSKVTEMATTGIADLQGKADGIFSDTIAEYRDKYLDEDALQEELMKRVGGDFDLDRLGELYENGDIWEQLKTTFGRVINEVKGFLEGGDIATFFAEMRRAIEDHATGLVGYVKEMAAELFAKAGDAVKAKWVLIRDKAGELKQRILAETNEKIAIIGADGEVLYENVRKFEFGDVVSRGQEELKKAADEYLPQANELAKKKIEAAGDAVQQRLREKLKDSDEYRRLAALGVIEDGALEGLNFASLDELDFDKLREKAGDLPDNLKEQLSDKVTKLKEQDFSLEKGKEYASVYLLKYCPECEANIDIAKQAKSILQSLPNIGSIDDLKELATLLPDEYQREIAEAGAVQEFARSFYGIVSGSDSLKDVAKDTYALLEGSGRLVGPEAEKLKKFSGVMSQIKSFQDDPEKAAGMLASALKKASAVEGFLGVRNKMMRACQRRMGNRGSFDHEECSSIIREFHKEFPEYPDDSDADGWDDNQDNCVNTFNPEQESIEGCMDNDDCAKAIDCDDCISGGFSGCGWYEEPGSGQPKCRLLTDFPECVRAQLRTSSACHTTLCGVDVPDYETRKDYCENDEITFCRWDSSLSGENKCVSLFRSPDLLSCE